MFEKNKVACNWSLLFTSTVNTKHRYIHRFDVILCIYLFFLDSSYEQENKIRMKYSFPCWFFFLLCEGVPVKNFVVLISFAFVFTPLINCVFLVDISLCCAHDLRWSSDQKIKKINSNTTIHTNMFNLIVLLSASVSVHCVIIKSLSKVTQARSWN